MAGKRSRKGAKVPPAAPRPAPAPPAMPPAPLPDPKHPLLPALAGPVLLFALLAVVVPPAQQDFPANDDWCYARGCYSFLHGEGPRYFGWASPILIGQWLWAFPFVQVLGENFFALRCSTLAAGLLGGFAFWTLLRQDGTISARAAGLATATLVLNPLYFVLGGSFMNDVPALAIALGALALLARGLRERQNGMLAAGAVLAVLALITRQNTVAVVPAATVLAWRTGQLRRPMVLAALAAPVLAAAGVAWWMGTRPDVMPFRMGWPYDKDPGLALAPARLWSACVLLGLAAAPLLTLGGVTGRQAWIHFGLAAGVLIVGIFLITAAGVKELPYVGNTITPPGAALFFNGGLVDGYGPPALPPDLTLLILIAGLAAGAAFLTRLDQVPRDAWFEPLPVFSLAHAAFLVIVQTQFDRYLLPLLPGVFYLVLRSTPAVTTSARRALAWGLVAVFAVGSTVAYHHWLQWNRARWAVGRRALERGIAAHDLEGGFEWDGWHLPDRALNPYEPAPPRPGFPIPNNPLRYPGLTGRYGLAFQELPPCRTLDSEPYWLPWPPGEHRIYLLEYVPPPEGRTSGGEPLEQRRREGASHDPNR